MILYVITLSVITFLAKRWHMVLPEYYIKQSRFTINNIAC